MFSEKKNQNEKMNRKEFLNYNHAKSEPFHCLADNKSSNILC